MNVKIGDTVEWTSFGGGRMRTKYGVIMDIVPPGATPIIPRGMKLATSRNDMAHERRHSSYLVLASGKVYWPKVKKLHLVLSESGFPGPWILVRAARVLWGMVFRRAA